MNLRMFLGVSVSLMSISRIYAQDCEVDVVIVLDASGSITDGFSKHIKYATELVKGMDIGPESQRVSLVLYNSFARIKFDFDKFQTNDAAVAGIEALPFLSGVTNTGKALTLAKELVQQRRNGVPLSVVVIHDGYSWDSALEPADQLRSERDVTIYAVGIVEWLNKKELEQIANRADMVYYDENSAGTLAKAILSNCRQADPTTPKPTTPRPTPRRTRATTRRATTVRRTTRRTTTTTTTTTPATTTFGGCFLDIVFVMDASGSVEETWEEELTLATKIVDLLILGERNAQVSMVKFAGRGKEKVVFPFGTYDDKEEMKAAILSVVYLSGTTDIAGALNLTNVQFKSDDETRSQAQKVAVLFTDGYSFSDPQPAAQVLRDSDVTIYAVAIRKIGINRRELEGITDDPDKVYTENEIDKFEEEYRRITTSCQ